ncbi:MAG: Gfo/Idh/MocA family oxidoreductase [Planctomycetia bacterium]|nr:Gfo/Idh/MocA family oxidoreductase [Planctomycetia bacterium]
MSSADHHVTRRTFIGTGAASAAALSALALPAASYAKVIGANERIRIGLIGAGVIGKEHIKSINALKEKDNVEGAIVADCWLTRAKQGAEALKAPKSTGDYRQVLDMKEVDYVVVAVPEHWHGKMTCDAMDAGKPVYCEKPMTHTIPEAQQVMKKQKETGLPLQVGVQAMSDDSYSSAAKAIEQGALGRVVQAQIEYVRHYHKNIGPWRIQGITDSTPKPDDLDWKAWLGHAPEIDWNPHHYHEWRNYRAYSGGIATDLFIHRITRIMKACNLLYPRRVVGMGGIWQWPDGRDLPDNFEMICEYPRGMTVYVLGTMSNDVPLKHQIRGTDATLQFTPGGWEIWTGRGKDEPGAKLKDKHEKTGGEDMTLHHHNFHNHLRKGEPLNCPIELGMAGVVAVNMANESWRTGTMMAWDKANEKMVPANTLPEQNHFPEAKA